MLLKGRHTLIGEPSVPPWVVSEGHPALASGGSGDVLAGITGALIAALGPLRAGVLGAFVHGRAERLWVEANGGADRGLFACELADSVPRAFVTADAVVEDGPGEAAAVGVEPATDDGEVSGQGDAPTGSPSPALPAPVPSLEVAQLFANIAVTRTAEGGVRIEAPPAAAAQLSELLVGLAGLLRAAGTSSER